MWRRIDGLVTELLEHDVRSSGEAGPAGGGGNVVGPASQVLDFDEELETPAQAAIWLYRAVSSHLEGLMSQVGSWARLRKGIARVYRRAGGGYDRTLREVGSQSARAVPGSNDVEVELAAGAALDAAQDRQAAAEYYLWLTYSSRQGGGAGATRGGFLEFLRGEYHAGRYPYRTHLDPIVAPSLGDVERQFGRYYYVAPLIPEVGGRLDEDDDLQAGESLPSVGG